MKRLIANPRETCKKLGLNQTDFWGRIGVTQSGGSRYESGRDIPEPTAIPTNIDAIIKVAKLGRERKGAQVDTCAVFAAALYDVLSAQGIQCGIVTVIPNGLDKWAHTVVEVAGRYYDSMGEFSASIYRARAKVHPTVKFEFAYRADSRCECYEPEFDELHAFFVRALNKAMCAGRISRSPLKQEIRHDPRPEKELLGNANWPEDFG